VTNHPSSSVLGDGEKSVTKPNPLDSGDSTTDIQFVIENFRDGDMFIRKIDP